MDELNWLKTEKSSDYVRYAYTDPVTFTRIRKRVKLTEASWFIQRLHEYARKAD